MGQGQTPYGQLYALGPQGRVLVRADGTGRLMTAGGNAQLDNYFLASLVDDNFNAMLLKKGQTTVGMMHGYCTLQVPMWVVLYDVDHVPDPMVDEPQLGFYLGPQAPFDKTVNLVMQDGLGVAFLADPTVPPAPVNAGFSAVTGFNLSFS